MVSTFQGINGTQTHTQTSLMDGDEIDQLLSQTQVGGPSTPAETLRIKFLIRRIHEAADGTRTLVKGSEYESQLPGDPNAPLDPQTNVREQDRIPGRVKPTPAAAWREKLIFDIKAATVVVNQELEDGQIVQSALMNINEGLRLNGTVYRNGTPAFRRNGNYPGRRQGN